MNINVQDTDRRDGVKDDTYENTRTKRSVTKGILYVN